MVQRLEPVRFASPVGRRAVVVGGSIAMISAGLGAVAAAARAEPFFARHRLPIGLQLYTLGDEAKDLERALKQVAALGYGTVELGLRPDRTPAQIRAALDAAGIACRSIHAPSNGSDGVGGDLSTLAESMRIIGARTVSTPFIPIPDRLDHKPAPGEQLYAWLSRILAQLTIDDWKAIADQLNRRGAALKQLGLRLGYHNHNFEFAPLGDTCGMEILLANTDPALVTFEIDIGWVAAAGRDPLALLRAHRGRFGLAHVKDIKPGSKPNFAMHMDSTDVGAGVLDWPALLSAAWDAGVREFYVEQEPPFAGPRIDAARRSHDYLARVVA